MRSLLVICLCAATTQAGEYTVTNKTSPYTVINNTTPLSPKKIVRDTLVLDGVIYEQGDDGVYRANGAVGVAPQTPKSQVGGITPLTSASNAVPLSTSLPDSMQMGRTFTLAPNVVGRGSTRQQCSTFG